MLDVDIFWITNTSSAPFPDSSVCPACLCQGCQGLWQNPSILSNNLVAMSSRDFQQTFQWWIWDSTDSPKICISICVSKIAESIPTIIFTITSPKPYYHFASTTEANIHDLFESTRFVLRPTSLDLCRRFLSKSQVNFTKWMLWMSELPWRYLRLDFFHPALKNPPRGLQKEKKKGWTWRPFLNINQFPLSRYLQESKSRWIKSCHISSYFRAFGVDNQ